MAEPGATPEVEPSPEMIVSRNSHNLIPNVEPEVDISGVGEAWKATFKVHWIGFASSFALLALYNVYQSFKACRRRRLPNKAYILTVQQLVILLALSRTLGLCLTPYELTNNVPNIPQVIPRILFGLGFPCLLSGFTFIHYIFLRISKVQIFLSRNVLSRTCVSVVLVSHFVTVVTADVIRSFVHGTEFLLIICAVYNIAGCLGISLSLLFSGRKVMKKTRQLQDNLDGFQLRERRDVVALQSERQQSNAASKVITITAAAVVLGLFSSILYVCQLVWMSRILASGGSTTPSPWAWLGVITLARICELLLAMTMTYAVCYSYREDREKKRSRTLTDNTVQSVNMSQL